MTHVHSNWDNSYNSTILHTDCYAGCNGITHIDNVKITAYEGDNGLDYVPLDWGGFGFDNDYTSIYKVENIIGGTEYKFIERTDIYGTFTISWGDGITDKDSTSHTYEKDGSYYIKFKSFISPIHCGIRSLITEVNKVSKYRTSPGSTADKPRYISIAPHGNLFQNGYNIKIIDLTNILSVEFNSLLNAFNGCQSLTTIIGISEISTSKVTNMSSVFNGCSSLTSLDLSSWDVSEVTNMSDMFRGCKKWTDFSFMKSWDLSSVTSFNGVFSNSGISEFSGIVANNIKGHINVCFQYCSNLTKVSYEGMNLINVTGNFYIGFISCSSLKEVSFKNTNLQVTSAYGMFQQCDLLETVDFTSCHFKYNSDSVAYNFRLTNSVKNIIFSENSFEGCSMVIINSTSLTVDSLLSLFNALVTISDSRTLNIGSANLAKLSSEQIKIATGKGWTVV